MNTQIDIYEKNKFVLNELVKINKELGMEYTEKFLIKEAKKRYKVGDLVKSFYHEKDNHLEIAKDDFRLCRGNSIHCSGHTSLMPVVYEKGQWATILPTKKKMTISEIEEKLGFEIEIV